MTGPDARSIKHHMDEIKDHLIRIGEIQTGRNTHPLVDDAVSDPFAFYVALRVEQMLSDASYVSNMLHNHLINLGGEEEYDYRETKLIEMLADVPLMESDDWRRLLGQLQNLNGIEGDGHASMYFDSISETTWLLSSKEDRIARIRDYLEQERKWQEAS